MLAIVIEAWELTRRGDIRSFDVVGGELFASTVATMVHQLSAKLLANQSADRLAIWQNARAQC